jgi:hypothetical protein
LVASKVRDGVPEDFHLRGAARLQLRGEKGTKLFNGVVDVLSRGRISEGEEKERKRERERYTCASFQIACAFLFLGPL